MAKRFFEDMVKVKNDSRIKTLKKEEPVISNSVIKETAVKTDTVEKKVPEIKTSIKSKVYFGKDGYKEVYESPKSNNTFVLWLIAIALIISCFFIISSKLSSAKINIDPKVDAVSLEDVLNAKRDLSINEEGLSYQLVIVESDQKKLIKSEGEKEFKEKASGKVILYNSFNDQPQSLNNDTRLLASNGKIYKTKEAVTIPGMKTEIPGSVEVLVYAEKEGEEYNSEPLDFNILGFKGTAKYEKFYGRSKGEIAGGFNGFKKIVDDILLKEAQIELENNLKSRLLEKAVDQIPANFILFKDATFYQFNSTITKTEENTELAEVVTSGTLYGFIFEEKDLLNEIINLKFSKEKEDIYLHNIKNLTFVLKDNSTSYADVKNIDFNLKGEFKVVYKVRNKLIIDDLLGKSKKDFANIISKYQSIDKADLKIKPLWQNKIPKDNKKIEIKVNYPE